MFYILFTIIVPEIQELFEIMVYPKQMLMFSIYSLLVFSLTVTFELYYQLLSFALKDRNYIQVWIDILQKRHLKLLQI